MSDEIVHRLSTEGVDPLSLAGVNDGNLVALAQRLGVRVSLRGDTLTLHGPLPAVERAVPVAQALVDLARMGGSDPLEVADVDRLVSHEGQGPSAPAADGEVRIILPGLRRVIQGSSNICWPGGSVALGGATAYLTTSSMRTARSKS